MLAQLMVSIWLPISLPYLEANFLTVSVAAFRDNKAL